MTTLTPVREIIADKIEAGTVENLLYPYGVGIDTHSKFIAVCILVRNGTVVTRHEKEFPTDWPSLIAAKNWIIKILHPEQHFRYCIESTGCYHLPVIRALEGKPSIVNPLLAGPTRRKTDVLDARLLANHSITGLWKESFRVTDQLQTLRILWAERSDKARTQRRVVNRINNTLLRFGHTFTPRYPLDTGEGQIILEAVINGKHQNVRSTCPENLPPIIAELLRAQNERQVETRAEIRDAQKIAIKFFREHKWPLGPLVIDGKHLMRILTSVPGIGESTATTWLAEIGDPTRFADAKQVAAYAGCDPSLKVSAGKVTSYTTRKGNTRLHNALVYAAQGTINRGSSPLADWGRAIVGRHKRGGYRKATGAVARRLAASLWHVHRLCTEYSDAQYNLRRVPEVPDMPLSTLGLSALAVDKLNQNGVTTTQQLAHKWAHGELASIPGFGERSMQQVRIWMNAINGRNPQKEGQENAHETRNDQTAEA